jgi:hypothetical protein
MNNPTCLSLLLLTLAPPLALAQSEPAPIPEDRPGLFVGAVSCGSSNCHGSVAPVAASPIRLDEYYLWSKDDPHADAYQVLEGRDSALIVRNLGLEQPAYQSAQCLACHALNPAPAQQRDRGSWSVVDEGISCEACHGPASGWLNRHGERSASSSEASEGWGHGDSVKAGLTDLRDPVARARVCLGCHLGDATRTVDHELLAAGHPVLRFELDNYSESPAVVHWKPLSAKSDASGWRQARGAPAWAVGQGMALAAALEQTARQARSGHWPEFIDLSCEACHHTLGAPGEERWRQPRRGVDSPFGAPLGYPAWSPQRWALLRPIVAALAPQDLETIEARLVDLARLSADFQTPPETVATAAEAALAALDGVLEAFRGHRWEPKTSRRLLTAVTDVDSATNYATADRAAAQQAAWAARTLLADLAKENPEILKHRVTTALEDLSDRVEAVAYDETAVREALGRVGAGVD